MTDEKHDALLEGLVTVPVGRRVDLGGRQAYVVRRAKGDSCGCCVFWCSQAGRLGECEFSDAPHHPAEVGECSAGLRRDGRAVIFVDRAEADRRRAAERKKREEERAWAQFARGFGSSRLGRAAAAEERERRAKAKKKNNPKIDTK